MPSLYVMTGVADEYIMLLAIHWFGQPGCGTRDSFSNSQTRQNLGGGKFGQLFLITLCEKCCSVYLTQYSFMLSV